MILAFWLSGIIVSLKHHFIYRNPLKVLQVFGHHGFIVFAGNRSIIPADKPGLSIPGISVRSY